MKWSLAMARLKDEATGLVPQEKDLSNKYAGAF